MSNTKIKYLLIVQTDKPTPDSLLKMVKRCFSPDSTIEISRYEQVIADGKGLPLYEIIIESGQPPYGKLPAYIKRLLRA
jgi:hypothetical protein